MGERGRTAPHERAAALQPLAKYLNNARHTLYQFASNGCLFRFFIGVIPEFNEKILPFKRNLRGALERANIKKHCLPASTEIGFDPFPEQYLTLNFQ